MELYKYKDVTGDGITHVEDMLSNNQIWFSSPTDFNDPFECGCKYDINNSREEVILRKSMFLVKKGASISDAIAQAEEDIPQQSNNVKEWQRQQIETHTLRAANTAMLCLTPICDNQVMWSHYAKKHEGICIQFRPLEDKLDSHLDFLAKAQQVDYSIRCPTVNFMSDHREELFRKLLLTKSMPYHYEKEWRLVLYNDGPGLKPIPEGIIGAIILGIKTEQEIEDRVIKASAEYEGDIEIVRANLNPETYGLRLDLIKTV